MAREAVERRKCMVGGPACYEVSATGPTVAVWGDSHAAALVPGLRAASLAKGYGFVALSRGDSPPLSGVSLYRSGQVKDAGCMEVKRNALNLFTTDRNIRIVILAGFWELPFRLITPGLGNARYWLTSESAKNHDISTLDASREMLRQSLMKTIRSLQEAGKVVIVIDDVPDFDFNPVSRVRTARMPVRHALAVLLGTVDATDSGYAPRDQGAPSVATAAIQEAVAGIPGVLLVELKPEFCRTASQSSAVPPASVPTVTEIDCCIWTVITSPQTVPVTLCRIFGFPRSTSR